MRESNLKFFIMKFGEYRHNINLKKNVIWPFYSEQFYNLNFKNFFFYFIKSHPEKKRTFQTCPFNATHLFEEPDRDKHLLECPDNYHAFTQPIPTRLNPIPSYERTNERKNNEEEDWDEGQYYQD